MARVDNLSNFLTDVADAIRDKKGTSATIAASSFDTEIATIVTSDDVKLQEKSVSPSTSSQSVTPDSDYDGLSKVTVNAMKLQTKTATPKTSSQNITPDSSYNGLSKVTVNAVTSNIDSNIKAGNIKKGVSILGVAGTLEESVAEDLTNEFNEYESGLTTQETTIDDIMTALQGKAAGSGSKLFSGGKLKWVFSSYDSATYCNFWGSLELEKTYEIYAASPGIEDNLVLSFTPTLLEGQNMGYTFNYIGYQGESLFGLVKIQDSLTYVGNIPDESFASTAISAICINFISSDGTDYSEDFNTFYWYIKEV